MERKKYLKKDGTLGRMLRGVQPVPADIRLASADPEVVKGVVSYFRTEVAKDINPHVTADLLDSFRVLIEKDVTIPDAQREKLKSLHAEDDLPLFLAETFLYAMNRFSKPDVEESKQKISIPLLLFTLIFGIVIYACTMFTIMNLGEVSQPLMAFAFFFAVALYLFLLGFYFFLWRRDI